MVVAARLPKDLAELIPPILQQAERHYAGAK